MLKARRDGYDGHGNALVNNQHELESHQLKGSVYAEQFVSFERELAVIVVRGHDGACVTYPTVETRQDPRLHICRTVLAPTDVDAGAIARAAVEAVGGVGTFGIELFQLADGQMLINELAPRPHNSGHYTIEACSTSQFSNHVRAVLGYPLGSPAMRAKAAVMVNILGADQPGAVDVDRALRIPETYVHLYGKEPRPGRKLGHITSLGSTTDEALQRAQQAAEHLRL
jgi:5-(carboxyamino)imidazole ribonucleotide synthase